MPLVLEEFGLARDLERFEPGSADAARRQFYAAMLRAALQAGGEDGAVAGVVWWAFAGEGRPREPGGFWRAGDALIGDPPHERQGWYSVFDSDAAMAKLISAAAPAWRSGNASAMASVFARSDTP